MSACKANALGENTMDPRCKESRITKLLGSSFK